MPISIYRRGLWFDGGDYHTLSGLTLNNSFTITMWIRPEAKTGVLFSTNINNNISPNSENHLRFGITSNLATYFDYFEGDIEIQERVTSVNYLVA